MLKEAGLNPGLLYAKGGAGGTTGGQSGGSASMGSAPQIQQIPMELSNAMMMYAQMELMKAEANKANAEADKTRGVDTSKAQTEIDKLVAETSNEKIKGELMEIQKSFELIRTANEQSVIDTNLKEAGQRIYQLSLQNSITSEAKESIIKQYQLNAIQSQMNIELTKANISKTYTEINAISTQLYQKWQELDIKAGELEQSAYKNETERLKERADVMINKFEAEIKAESPGLLNVAGSIAKKAYDVLEQTEINLRGATEVRDEVK